jgi:hypothetical protein
MSSLPRAHTSLHSLSSSAARLTPPQHTILFYFFSVADPDPGSGAFSTPGSGIQDPGGVESQHPDPGSGIRRGKQPGSYFLGLITIFVVFLGLKYLNSLMRIRDPGWRQFGSGIRDGKKSDPGSGITTPDPQHCFFTVLFITDYCAHVQEDRN